MRWLVTQRKRAPSHLCMCRKIKPKYPIQDKQFVVNIPSSLMNLVFLSKHKITQPK